MQSGRLFEIIYLLMDRHRMTASELARELEVSPRTIRRDIDALSAAGIPVYMTRGKGGGVHLMPHFVLDKSIVSESEQTEILAALSALRTTGASDGDETVERLARVFQRDNVDWIDIDFSFWGAPPEYRHAFEIIREATTSRRLLRFEYYDAAGTASTRTVEPAKLIFKESSWYMQAFCLERNDWRTFKLFRMKWPTMEILDQAFTARPIPHAIDGVPRAGAGTTLKMLFGAASEHRVREEFAPATITARNDGRFLVTLEAPLDDRMRHYLLSYGAELEVLEPRTLRTWIREQAQAIAGVYREEN